MLVVIFGVAALLSRVCGRRRHQPDLAAKQSPPVGGGGDDAWTGGEGRSKRQYAAGAGQPAAAYCLYLHRLAAGEDTTASW
ncbi:hypothetical protein ABZ478_37300 [Streptomyces sp. NPDC005706]|uniref:hypothetical protein n=1 Tax=Streptomyces sp. NPDC005706 TaxID=3157169 RepID=UPI0033D46D8C